MQFIYNDGGRSNYFKASNVGDCVCRALCNTTGVDYKVMYNLINKIAKLEKVSNCSKARDGVYRDSWKKILKALGAQEIKVQEFGSSIKCHLCDEDLIDYQRGKYILSLSHHLSSLINGKIVDTYDCSRDGDRQVYKMYKMTKTTEEYNQLIEKFNQDLDKKLDNKEKKETREVKRNIRLHKQLETIDNQIEETKKLLSSLREQRAQIVNKIYNR